MLKFARPEILYLLLLIPLLVMAELYIRKHYKKRFNRFISAKLQKRVIDGLDDSLSYWKMFLQGLLFTFLTVALANPQLGTHLEMVKRKGVDVVIALDVSKSMLANDIAPSRLDKAKKEIRDLMNIMRGDRIGIVCFSGDAFVQVPLTVDYAAVEMYLDAVSPGIIAKQGTAIGKAVKLSMDSFTEEGDKYRVIILMTDGEDHAAKETGDRVEEAANRKIKIFCVGFGSPDGSLIPETDGSGRIIGYKKDKKGNYITSRLNDGLLRRIAEKTGAKFYYATPSAHELKDIYERINNMEKKDISEREFTQFEDRFQIFIAMALISFLLIFFLREKRTKFV